MTSHLLVTKQNQNLRGSEAVPFRERNRSAIPSHEHAYGWQPASCYSIAEHEEANLAQCPFSGLEDAETSEQLSQHHPES